MALAMAGFTINDAFIKSLDDALPVLVRAVLRRHVLLEQRNVEQATVLDDAGEVGDDGGVFRHRGGHLLRGGEVLHEGLEVLDGRRRAVDVHGLLVLLDVLLDVGADLAPVRVHVLGEEDVVDL